jgi:Tfp pilus assembly protein PilP
MIKGKRVKNKLFRIMASFLFFWAVQPGAVSSETNPETGTGPECARDISGKGSLQASVQSKFKLSGLKDPFKPFILEQKASVAPKAGKPRTYLETVDLSQLELIAIIVSPDDRWAMLRDVKGIGYVVKHGTPVGIDGGRVHQISPGEIIIRSNHRNAKGETIKRDTAKRLFQ